jgi:hypothetical protein
MLFSNGSYDSSSLDHIDCNFVIPVHCHQLDFVNYFHYNDIIFSQTAQGTSFTYVKICTYLIENTKYIRVYTHIIILVFFWFFFCFFLAISNNCKIDMCPFYIYNFLHNTCFCNKHSYWLQLSLAASISKSQKSR